jgi:amidophosphoribosyltransferase
VPFSSTSDSEIIAALLATHPAERIEDAVAEVLPRLKGAFSTVVMTDEAVIAFRDPHGLRPLALGVIEDRLTGSAAYCVASESCAFDLIGARYLRDVQPGEVLTLTDRGLKTRLVAAADRQAMCVFEYIYFARPDSRMAGTVLQVARARMGEILWREAPVDADVVIPIPDSGNAAARGLARASGLPQDDGFIKNRYVARTFIQPGQELRSQGVRMKFNLIPEVVRGKRLIVVDDSIVRGNTTRQIVQMLFDSGAAEVHVRISSPPVVSQCYYGIDLADPDELIAANKTVEEVREYIGATSLAYISLEGLQASTRRPESQFCRACLTRDYPTAIPREAAKLQFEPV